jgi:hypothetical protein
MASSVTAGGTTCPYVPTDQFSWGEQRLPPNLSCPYLPWNPVAYCTIAAAHAVSYWIMVEFSVSVLLKFKRRDTLYFL